MYQTTNLAGSIVGKKTTPPLHATRGVELVQTMAVGEKPSGHGCSSFADLNMLIYSEFSQ